MWKHLNLLAPVADRFTPSIDDVLAVIDLDKPPMHDTTRQRQSAESLLSRIACTRAKANRACALHVRVDARHLPHEFCMP